MTLHRVYKRYRRQMSTWGIPAMYVIAATRLRSRFLNLKAASSPDSSPK